MGAIPTVGFGVATRRTEQGRRASPPLAQRSGSTPCLRRNCARHPDNGRGLLDIHDKQIESGRDDLRLAPRLAFHFHDPDVRRGGGRQRVGVGAWPISLVHAGPGACGSGPQSLSHRACRESGAPGP